ncbi:ferric reductase like transmembrane component [Pseudomonas sp. C1C7]|uniref:ferric reductase-like transmembrane domain-containing protein n=1 Tax=Pseudomonas sp. C1C7 TaxID=2735272 RepID=UPI001586E98E|nr:ferric reductase like transmembrane component [Pseudomonas sp. C1C7]
MVALLLRLTLLVTLPFVLLLFMTPMPGIDPAWDFANGAGFLAGILLAALFIYSGRPLSEPYYDGKFFMNLHRDLGYAATLLLALHVGVLLISEPQVVDYLKPSATWPMLSGTLATLLLLVLVPTSLSAVRKKLWRNHRHFKLWHYGLGALMLVLVSVHMLSAGFYTAALWKWFFWVGLIGAAILRPLLPRAALVRGGGSRRRHTASYASWLCAGMVVIAITLALGYSLLANSDLPL